MRFTGIQRPEEFGSGTRAHIIAWRDDVVHEQIETTQIYLHADLELKERPGKNSPDNITPGRYRPPVKASRLSRDALIMPAPSQRSPPAGPVSRRQSA
jgi:hypothetical protein